MGAEEPLGGAMTADAYDKQRDDRIDFPENPQAEPTLEETVYASRSMEQPFECIVDESAGFRHG